MKNKQQKFTRIEHLMFAKRKGKWNFMDLFVTSEFHLNGMLDLIYETQLSSCFANGLQGKSQLDIEILLISNYAWIMAFVNRIILHRNRFIQTTYLIGWKSTDAANFVAQLIVANIFVNVRYHNFAIVGGFHFDFGVAGVAVVHHLCRHFARLIILHASMWYNFCDIIALKYLQSKIEANVNFIHT